MKWYVMKVHDSKIFFLLSTQMLFLATTRYTVIITFF